MDVAYPFGKPVANATLKAIPEDFIVQETLPFVVSGEGDHIYLKIEKRNLNTEQVASLLARFVKVPSKFVSFAGLKDKEAVTQQWFSIKSNKTLDFSVLNDEHLTVLESTRHNKKLKRGAVKQNQFTIRLLLKEPNQEAIKARLEEIKQFGFANYFGPQRFGNDGNNLKLAQSFIDSKEAIQKRQLRARIYSTIRSFLFNTVLNYRVQDQSWLTAIPGDKMMFHNNNAVFDADDDLATLNQRIQSGDIHPSGPLEGLHNELITTGAARDKEQTALKALATWQAYLEENQLELGRRGLRARVYDFDYTFSEDGTAITLCFRLNAGCYATTMLSHCFNLVQNKETSDE